MDVRGMWPCSQMSVKIITMISNRVKRRGFNLLEVVIACFIFSVTTLAFLGVWGMQVRAVEKSRHSMVATFIAEGLIAEARSLGYERTVLGLEVFDGETEPYLQVETEIRGPDGTWNTSTVKYHAQRFIQEEDVTPAPYDDKVRSVLVTVTWEDSSKVGEIKLETLVAGVF